MALTGSPSSVLTDGLGSWGSVGLVISTGLGSSLLGVQNTTWAEYVATGLHRFEAGDKLSPYVDFNGMSVNAATKLEVWLVVEFDP